MLDVSFSPGKYVINEMIYHAHDIMEINPLILVNQLSMRWTAEYVQELRGNINFIIAYCLGSRTPPWWEISVVGHQEYLCSF